MARPTQNRADSTVQGERDFPPISRLVMLLFCGAALTGGFIFAARQHFVAVQYGYQNEELRLERQRLMAEEKRLTLEKEQAASPLRIRAAAEQLGMKPLQPGQIVSLRESKPNGSQPAVPAKPAVPNHR